MKRSLALLLAATQFALPELDAARIWAAEFSSEKPGRSSRAASVDRALVPQGALESASEDLSASELDVPQSLELQPVRELDSEPSALASQESQTPAPPSARSGGELATLVETSRQVQQPHSDPGAALSRALDGASIEPPSVPIVEPQEAPSLEPLHQLIPASRWSALRDRLEASFDALPIDRHRLAQGVDGVGYRAAAQVEIRRGERGLDIRMMPGATFRSGFGKSHLPGMARETALDPDFRGVLAALYEKLPEQARRRGVKISVHQMRVMEGEVVERPHRDHYTDYIAMWVVGRRNAAGAESRLYVDDAREPRFAKTLDSGEILLLDNRAFLHYVSELRKERPGGAPAARDVFVFAIRMLPAQVELAPADRARGLDFIRRELAVPSPNFPALEAWWKTGDAKIQSATRWLAGIWGRMLSRAGLEPALKFLEPSYEPWTSVEYVARYVSYLEKLEKMFGRQTSQEDRDRRAHSVHVAHRDMAEAIAKAAGGGLDQDMAAEKISDWFYDRVLKPLLEVDDDKFRVPEKFDREALIQEAAKGLAKDVYRYTGVDARQLETILRGGEIRGLMEKFLGLVENPVPPAGGPNLRDRDRAPAEPTPEAKPGEAVPLTIEQRVKEAVKKGGKLALLAAAAVGAMHFIGEGGHGALFAATAMALPAFLVGVEPRAELEDKLPDHEMIVEETLRQLRSGGGTSFLTRPEWAGEPSRAVVEDVARRLETEGKRTLLLDLQHLRREHAGDEAARSALFEEIERLADGKTVLWIDRADELQSLIQNHPISERLFELTRSGTLQLILSYRQAPAPETVGAVPPLPAAAGEPALAQDTASAPESLPLNEYLASLGLSEDEIAFISGFATDIGAQPAMPVIGRAEEIEQAVNILSIPSGRPNSVALLGAQDVGKSAVYKEVARRVYRNRVASLQGKRILDFRLVDLMMGVGGATRWQRLREIVAKTGHRLIIGVEELGSLNRDAGVAGAAADFLGPAIEDGSVTLFGTALDDAEHGWNKNDLGLVHRFQTIPVAEPSPEAAQEMIEGILAPLERDLDVSIRRDLPAALIELAARVADGRLPGKAVRFLTRAANARRRKVAAAALQVRIDRALERMRLDLRHWSAIKAEGGNDMAELEARQWIASSLRLAAALQQEQNALAERPIGRAELERQLAKERGDKTKAEEPAPQTPAEGPLAEQLQALLDRVAADPSALADLASLKAALFPNAKLPEADADGPAVLVAEFRAEPLKEHAPGKAEPALDAALAKVGDPALKKLIKQLVAEARAINLDSVARRVKAADFAALEKKSQAKAAKAIEQADRDRRVTLEWRTQDAVVRIRIDADAAASAAHTRRLEAALSSESATPEAGESRLFEIRDALSRRRAKAGFSKEPSSTSIWIDWPTGHGASAQTDATDASPVPESLKPASVQEPPAETKSAGGPSASQRMLKLSETFLNPKASDAAQSAASAEELRALMRQQPAAAGARLEQLLLKTADSWRDFLVTSIRQTTSRQRGMHRVIRATMIKREEMDLVGGRTVPNARVRDLFETLRLLWRLHPEMRTPAKIRANVLDGLDKTPFRGAEYPNEEREKDAAAFRSLLDWTEEQGLALLGSDERDFTAPLLRAFEAKTDKEKTRALDAILADLRRFPERASPAFEAMLLQSLERWRQHVGFVPDDSEKDWKTQPDTEVFVQRPDKMQSRAAPGVQRLFALYLRLIELRPELVEAGRMKGILERAFDVEDLYTVLNAGDSNIRYGAAWWTWRTFLDLAIALSERRPDVFSVEDLRKLAGRRVKPSIEDDDVRTRIAYHLLERSYRGAPGLDDPGEHAGESVWEFDFSKLERAGAEPAGRGETPVDAALIDASLALRGEGTFNDPGVLIAEIKRRLKSEGERAMSSWTFRRLVQAAAISSSFHPGEEAPQPQPVPAPARASARSRSRSARAPAPPAPSRPAVKSVKNIDKLLKALGVDASQLSPDAERAARMLRSGQRSEKAAVAAAETLARAVTR